MPYKLSNNSHWYSATFALITQLSFISILTCFVLAASPFLSFNIWTDTGYHNNQRILVSLLLSTIPVWLLWHATRQTRIDSVMGNKIFWPLCVFFIIGLVSSFNAYSQRFALYEWSGLFLLLILAWLISEEIRIHKEQLINLVLKVCGFGCALYIFKSLLIYITIIAVGAQAKPSEMIFGFDNYRFFNHIQSISLPILSLQVFWSSKNNGWRRFWIAALLLWWMLLFVSSGRGTLVGLMAGLLLVIFFRRRLASEWVRLIIGTGIAGFAAYLFLYEAIPFYIGWDPLGHASEIVQRTLESPTSSRIPLWNLAWQMTLEYPWLGMGPIHFAHYGANLRIGAHPHNWILQISSEWGVPALLCLFMAIGFAFRALLKIQCEIQESDQRNQAALAAWIHIGGAILVDGLVSGLIVMPTSQVWIALYLGCAWGWIKYLSPVLNIERAENAGSMKFFVATAIIVASVLTFLWLGLLPEAFDLSSYEQRELDSDTYIRGYVYPRIWSTGFF